MMIKKLSEHGWFKFQENLKVVSHENARRVVGNKIIGVSTHSPKEAQHAKKSGADDITAGPVFKDDPKKNDEGAGLKYLEYAVQNSNLPVVAIGGINEYNLTQVLEKGAKIVAFGELTGPILNLANQGLSREPHII